MSQSPRPSVLGRRVRLWVAIVAGLVALYAVLGFFVLPAVIRAQLPPRLGKLLDRQVSLARARTNPFTLSVTLEGFLVNDRDGEPLLGWRRLYVNAQLSSLLTRTVSLKAIELTEPYGRVVVEKDGKPSFADIVERLTKAEPARPPEPAAKPRQVAIGHLAIQGARLVLEDRHLSQPFTTTLGPVSLDLTGFRTEPDSNSPYTFTGRTESGESFAWAGSFSLDPLSSEGHVALDNLLLPKYQPFYRDLVAFDLRKGTASAQGSYIFHWSAGEHELRVGDASFEVRGLEIAEAGQEKPVVAIPLLEGRGIQADLLKPSVEIGSLTARDGAVELVRLPDGGMNLTRLVATSQPAPAKDTGQPMSLLLRQLEMSGFRVSFEDRAAARPVHAVLEGLNVRLNDFDLDPSHSMKVHLDTHLNGPGTLDFDGTVAAFKPAFDLAVKAADLAVSPFDPYLAPSFDVRVNSGVLSANGRVSGSFEQGTAEFIAFEGDARLDGFEAMDSVQREPFLRYKSLRLAGLELRTDPRVLKLRSAELIEPENRLVIAPDGTSNVARALKLVPPPGEAGNASQSLGAVAPPTPEGPGKAPFEVAIAKVRIQGGKLTFVDRTLEPNVALLITDLTGSYTGLSTRPETQSAVEIRGMAGGLAPVLIQGRAMPLRNDKDTDVTLSIQGAQLSDFDPYAEKYLGYTIRKGKLDVDAHLRIQERKLDVQDKVILDQFFLGDKTSSPDATKLPVKLALALLRDRKGVIDLDIPVQGSLDDPNFRYGKAVWHAVLNVFTKIVTSPFALLGKLFGGGQEDLSFATFAPGSAVPDADAVKKASVLAKALVERPELTLEVEGTTDPDADVAALRKAGLERLLREAKVRSLAASGASVDLESVTVTPEERDGLLKAAFEAAFPAPAPEKGKEAAAAPVPPPPPAEMEQRLLATITVSADDLRQLADARTRAMIALLLRDGSIEASRVFAVAGGEGAAKQGGARVYFTVK